jgi:aryl-alcohol dehydrogenase-like predicted oxidoreductase
MELHDYVTLGRSGLRVSPMCLGAMTFGSEWGIGEGPESAQALLHEYTSRGGNFIDTANIYNRGHSEKILGDWWANDPLKRERTVLATKFGGNLFPNDPNGGGSGRKAIFRQCEDSLRRLRTDYIDLYWLHFQDVHTPIEKTMGALDRLVRDGKVRYLGFSDTPAWKVCQAHTFALLRGLTPLIALQVEYSLLERTVEGELLPMARELGLGVTPWSPLRGGVLTGKYTRTGGPATGRSAGKVALDERGWKLLDELAAVAREADCTAAQAALAWVSRRPGVASPILGARTVDQLRDNLGALSVSLTEDQTRRLDEASKPTLNFPHGFLTFIPTVIHGGLSINGARPQPWPNAPKTDADRF